jgi:hypothetical protein
LSVDIIAEAAVLGPHLMLFSGEHAKAAVTMDEDVRVFEAEMKAALEELWIPSNAETQNATPHSVSGEVWINLAALEQNGQRG